MILPIVAYGHPVLRKMCDNIDPSYPELQTLIENMWATMYHTNGVGIAAPQVNVPIRLFVVDTVQIVEGFDEEDKLDYPNEIGIKKVFINAQIQELSGNLWAYNEGCLSIPKVREDVKREEKVRIKYLDENFQEHEEEFEGITARVILHEYDHIDGKLFIDYLSPLKKKLIKKRLDDIIKGKVNIGYRMLFSKK